jgi:hypothetical protein
MDLYEVFRHESQGFEHGTENGDYEYHEKLGWVLKRDQEKEDQTEKNKD